jgi:hypothetical protein
MLILTFSWKNLVVFTYYVQNWWEIVIKIIDFFIFSASLLLEKILSHIIIKARWIDRYKNNGCFDVALWCFNESIVLNLAQFWTIITMDHSQIHVKEKASCDWSKVLIPGYWCLAKQAYELDLIKPRIFPLSESGLSENALFLTGGTKNFWKSYWKNILLLLHYSERFCFLGKYFDD